MNSFGLSPDMQFASPVTCAEPLWDLFGMMVAKHGEQSSMVRGREGGRRSSPEKAARSALFWALSDLLLRETHQTMVVVVAI